MTYLRYLLYLIPLGITIGFVGWLWNDVLHGSVAVTSWYGRVGIITAAVAWLGAVWTLFTVVIFHLLS